MKKKTSILLLLLFVSFACNESTTEPPINKNINDFFPNSDGNYYNYNVLVYDSSGIFVQSGTRKSYYDVDTIIYSTPYQVRTDEFQLTSLQTVNNSYFKKNSTGVFVPVDFERNGFYYLMPDSLRGGYSFVVEYTMLYLPPEVNQNWSVFKVNVNLLYVEFEFFKVDAEVLSLDTLTISFQNITRTVEALKIKYNARLTTGLSQPPLLFEVHAWIAKGIGFIKWEGNSELINFFAGAEIYPINTIVLEELESFKVN
ncbi:MAG TPA: hypothetical protein VLH59_00785 [Ignavibacteriaceae bacterium]|nr:hypothetical protein [Ignavibacteriaceae bacterium]